jgi:hypothetical protein
MYLKVCFKHDTLQEITEYSPEVLIKGNQSHDHYIKKTWNNITTSIYKMYYIYWI